MKSGMIVLLLLLPGVTSAASRDDDELERVASPLVSEVEISPVAMTIMKGGWWHDRSAAHLSVEDAILRSIGIARSKKKKTVSLLVRAEVGSESMMQNVDEVLIELLDSRGELLGTKRRRGLVVGRDGAGVSETKYVTLEYKTSQAGLEALFAGGAKPVARVTITEVE